MQLTGIGLYTFPEAARLTGIASAQLRRWLIGYRPSSSSRKPPIWETDLAAENLEGLSFFDLLEVRLVRHFRNLGISLQTIRLASKHAKELFHSSHPFICQQFLTDGKSIFAEAFEASDENNLIDLRHKQFVINQVVRPSLYSDLEYDGDQPQRWFPMEKIKSVVLDPKIAFGKPIVMGTGLRTQALFDAWLAENEDYRRVSLLYEVPVSAVRSAVRFEQKLPA